MPSKTWYANKDARIAQRQSDSWSAGAGKSSYNPVGLYSGYLYRTLLGFSPNWTGVSKISSAYLYVRTSTQYYVAFGSDPDVYVERLTGSWSEGSSTGLSGTNAVEWDNQPASTNFNRATKDVTTSQSTWVAIDITAIIEDIAPTSVKRSDGSAGGAATFTGLRLIAVNEASSTDVTEFYSRETSSDPYILLWYFDNAAPNPPTLVSPVGGGTVAGTTPTLQFTHSDPDGDACSSYDLQVTDDATFATVTHWDILNQTSGISGNDISRAYGGIPLTRGTTYYWRARTTDPDGETGDWAVADSFVANQLPTVTKNRPHASGDLAQIHNLQTDLTVWTAAGAHAKPKFQWTFNDPDGDAQAAYELEVSSDASGTPVVYQPGEIAGTANFHDATLAIEHDTPYWWRIRVKDSAGEWSSWSSWTRFKVLWSQVRYEDSPAGGASSSNWTFDSGNVPTGTQKAFLFGATAASGGTPAAWKDDIGAVTPNTYLQVLVRLATYISGTNATLPDMTFGYIGSAVQPDKWTTQTANPADWELTESIRRFGTQSFRCVISTTTGDRYVYPWTSTEGDDVLVAPNTDYTFSAFVKTDGALTGSVGLDIFPAGSLTGPGTTVTYTDTADQSTTDSATHPEGWQRLSVRFKTNAGVTRVRPMVYYTHDGSTAGDIFYVDAVKLEEGNVATAWAPGFVGDASVIDAGGIAVDGSAGGIFRLRGTDGGARDVVALGARSWVFGGDLEVYSDVAGILTVDATGVDTDAAVRINADVGNAASLELGEEGTYDVSVSRPAANTLALGGTGTLIRHGGTAFPGSPVDGDVFHRTDLDMTFFYDGTRWLSVVLFDMPAVKITDLSATSSDAYRLSTPPLRGGSDLWIEDVVYAGFHIKTGGTALSASHKWTVEVQFLGVGGSTDNVGTYVIDSGASASWRAGSTVAVDQQMNSIATRIFTTAVATKTGTPGNLYIYGTYTYRVIAT